MVCLVVLWLILVASEQTCDVWDETDLLLNNSTAPSTVDLLRFLWTHHIYFYRPLGACVIGLISRSLDKAPIGALLLVILPVFLYWGMFGVYRNHILVTGAHFQGRLYLVPAALLLLWLATWGRRAVLVILLVPVLLGAFRTYRDHLRFQGCYAQIHELQDADTVTVDYPEKPLNDWRRHILVGDYPEAGYRVDARSGMVITKASNAGAPPPLPRTQRGKRE